MTIATTTIPSFLAVLLPLVVGPLATRDKRLALWQRAIIAVVVSLIGAIAWAFYEYSLIPSNPMNIALSIVVYIGVLASGPLQPLYTLASPHLQVLWRQTMGDYEPEVIDDRSFGPRTSQTDNNARRSAIAAKTTAVVPAIRIDQTPIPPPRVEIDRGDSDSTA